MAGNGLGPVTCSQWMKWAGEREDPMTEDERYNGWTNRETWAVNLWLSNDEGLYLQTQELTQQARQEAKDGDRTAVGLLADALQEFLDELFDPDEHPISSELMGVRNDVGSLWRVDWFEIAEAWIADSLEGDPDEDEDEDEDEDSEPSEGDYLITDSPAGVTVSIAEGGHWGDFPDRDIAELAIRANMERDQYWPNVWWISDHGNAHLITL